MSTLAWIASACLDTLASSSDRRSTRPTRRARAGGPAVTATCATGIQCQCTDGVDQAASARTGGWMPRTRARSSASALLDASRASDQRLRVARGQFEELLCDAQRHAHRHQSACAPSCRSRSMRRISAARRRWSRTVSARCWTRSASSIWPAGPRIERASIPYAVSIGGRRPARGRSARCSPRRPSAVSAPGTLARPAAE